MNDFGSKFEQTICRCAIIFFIFPSLKGDICTSLLYFALLISFIWYIYIYILTYYIFWASFFQLWTWNTMKMQGLTAYGYLFYLDLDYRWLWVICKYVFIVPLKHILYMKLWINFLQCNYWFLIYIIFSSLPCVWGWF